MTRRPHVLGEVARSIMAIAGGGMVRVGVDGVDGAGKTIFADELALALRESGRTVIRASVDSFHNPRAVRYRPTRR